MVDATTRSPEPPAHDEGVILRRRLVISGLVTLIAAILGVNLVSLKVAIEASDPVTVQGLSMAVAILSMFVVARSSGAPIMLERRWWRAAGGVALALAIGSSLGIAFGVERVDAGLAALLVSTMPIFTLVLDLVVLRQRHSWHGYAGVCIGMLGVAIVSLGVGQTGDDTQLLGIVFLLLGSFGWALGLVLMKLLAAGAPRSTLLAWTFVLGTPVLLAVAAVTSGLRVEWSLLVVAAILYTGAAAKGISFFLQLTVVRLGSPVHASLTAFLMPVFGSLAGVAWLGETIEVVEFVGAVPILLGVGLVLRSRVAQRSDESTEEVIAG